MDADLNVGVGNEHGFLEAFVFDDHAVAAHELGEFLIAGNDFWHGSVPVSHCLKTIRLAPLLEGDAGVFVSPPDGEVDDL